MITAIMTYVFLQALCHPVFVVITYSLIYSLVVGEVT